MNPKNLHINISKWKCYWSFLLCLIVFVGVFPQQIFAQKAVGELDRQQIVLGEQANLRLKLNDVPSGYELTSFYGWDSSTHAEIVGKGKIDTVNLNHQYTYIQDWKVTSFDSGKWALPIRAAVLKNQQTGKQMVVPMDSIYLNVMPVDISNMKDYHDIKDILTVKYFDPFWIIVGVIAIVVILLTILIIRYWMKRKKRKPTLLKKIKGTPIDWALSEIEKLRAKKVSVPIYFGELDEIIRTYLHEKADLPTHHETSEELIMRMRDLYKSDIVGDQFYQNLKLIDAVKFAKYIPSETVISQKTNDIVESLKTFDKKINESSTK